MYRFVSTIAISTFLFIAWIIYLSNTGGRSIFIDYVRGLPSGDKYGHAILFGFLAFCTIFALKFKTLSLLKLKIYLGLVIVTIFVVAEEISQAFIARRTFDLLDLAADFIGLSSATVLAFLVNKFLLKRNTHHDESTSDVY